MGRPALADAALPLLALSCLLCAQALAGRKRLPYPPAREAVAAGDTAGMADAGFLAFGARRLGADAAFIKLLQYYGKHEGESEDEYSGFYVYGLRQKPGWRIEGGVYPDFLAHARHVLWLDPYYKFAALYSASALAFNLNRPQEALEILAQARQWLPREWQYDVLSAAIAYSKSSEPEKQARELDRVITDPQAPDLLRQLAAFLNKKAGNYRRAYQIYGDLLESANPGYAANAAVQRRLLEPMLSP